MPSFANDPFVYLRSRAIKGGGSGGVVPEPPAPPVESDPQGVFTVSPYDFTGRESYLVSSLYSDSYEDTFNASRHPTDGYIDIRADILMLDVSQQQVIFSRWTPGNTNSGNSSYLFLNVVDGQRFGNLAFFYYDATGSGRYFYCDIKTSTFLQSKARGWVRAVLNAGTTAKNGFGAGTLTFLYSSDGSSWSTLGSVISVPQQGLRQGGNTSACVGTISPGTEFHGRFYRVLVTASDGRTLYAPDFTTKAVGQKGSFADSAGASWVINGPIICDMAPRPSTYPRLKSGQDWKLKTLEISPDAQFSAANGDWGRLWSNYPSANFAERIQWAKAHGANSVKWTCSGSRVSYNNYPTLNVLEAYISDVCGILRAERMFLYLSLAHSDEIAAPNGDGREARTAEIAATAALWMKYGSDLIVGCDICNEVQFGFAPSTAGLPNNGRPSTWGSADSPSAGFFGDMAYFYKEIRRVMPDVPMSFSAYMPSRAALGSNGFLNAQAALEMQFHDYHPYNGLNGKAAADDLTTGQFPASADPVPLESAQFFLGGHLIGECGIQRRHNASNKAAMFNGLIAQASRTLSFGFAGAFIDYDYTSSNEPGDYGIRQDATLTDRFVAIPSYTVPALP